MKENSILVTVILDKSGSMKSLRDETINGFNEFLKEQRSLPGECKVSLVQFDDKYEESYHLVDINDVADLNHETYKPRGWTKLYDAIGKTINSVGEKLAALPESERPEKVVVAIQTDGYENSSSEFNRAQISEMIKHQTEKYNWQFVYLGANQDAILEGGKIGILRGSTITYNATGAGVNSVYKSLSKNISDYRLGSKLRVTFEEKDRLEQTNS